MILALHKVSCTHRWACWGCQDLLGWWGQFTAPCSSCPEAQVTSRAEGRSCCSHCCWQTQRKDLKKCTHKARHKCGHSSQSSGKAGPQCCFWKGSQKKMRHRGKMCQQRSPERESTHCSLANERCLVMWEEIFQEQLITSQSPPSSGSDTWTSVLGDSKAPWGHQRSQVFYSFTLSKGYCYLQ